MAWAAVQVTGSGSIVAGVAGQKIVLEAYQLSPAGSAAVVKWQSWTNAGSTDLTGTLQIPSNTTVGADSVQMGICITNAGEDLRLNQTTAVAVGGWVRYSLRY